MRFDPVPGPSLPWERVLAASLGFTATAVATPIEERLRVSFDHSNPRPLPLLSAACVIPTVTQAHTSEGPSGSCVQLDSGSADLRIVVREADVVNYLLEVLPGVSATKQSKGKGQGKKSTIAADLTVPDPAVTAVPSPRISWLHQHHTVIDKFISDFHLGEVPTHERGAVVDVDPSLPLIDMDDVHVHVQLLRDRMEARCVALIDQTNMPVDHYDDHARFYINVVDALVHHRAHEAALRSEAMCHLLLDGFGSVNKVTTYHPLLDDIALPRLYLLYSRLAVRRTALESRLVRQLEGLLEEAEELLRANKRLILLLKRNLIARNRFFIWPPYTYKCQNTKINIQIL